MDIERPGFERRWHFLRMVFIITVNAAAANQKRFHRKSRLHIQPAGSLWSQKRLMPGKTEHVDSELLHGKQFFPCSLRRIHNQKQSIPFNKRRNIGKIRHISCHVGRAGNYHRTRLWAQKCFQLFIF